MQILFVEDDKRISQFLVKRVSKNGHSIVLCQSTEEFLEQYLSLQWVNL